VAVEAIEGLGGLVLYDYHYTERRQPALLGGDFFCDVWMADLGHTQIGDDGLKHLSGLTELKSLSLNGTQVTDQGIKKLQQALPNCNIVCQPTP
jgi:hypothetical protein